MGRGSTRRGAQTAANHSTSVGVLLVLGSCLSLQFGAAVAMQLFPQIGSWGTTALRLGLAAMVLLLLVRPKFWTWSSAQWRAVVAYGLSLGLMNGFFFAAIARIPLGVAVSVEFTGPLVLAVVLSRRRSDLIWIGLAAAGMVLLGLDSFFGETSFDPIGILFALIAGVFWAAYIIFSARTGELVAGSGGLAVALVVGAAVVTIPGFGGVVEAAGRPELWIFALGTALLSSLIPYSLELAALRRLPAGVFSVLLSLEPVFAAVIGWLVLDQTFGWLRGVAMVLVVIASAGTTRSSAQPKLDPELAADDD